MLKPISLVKLANICEGGFSLRSSGPAPATDNAILLVKSRILADDQGYASHRLISEPVIGGPQIRS